MGRNTQAFPETGRTDTFRPAGDTVGFLSDPWSEFPGTARKGTSATDGADHDQDQSQDQSPDQSPDQGPDPDHDPHEVTVQLDGLQIGKASAGRRARRAQEASDKPVFVDATGRRGRTVRRLGMAVGIACAVYAVVIVVTLLSGSSDAPWLPVPGQHKDKPASKVDTSPAPADSARPSSGGGSRRTAPGVAPSAGKSGKPGKSGKSGSPSAGTSKAPRGSTAPAEPGTSTAPRPTHTKSAPEPGGGVAPSVPEQTSAPESSAPATQSSPPEGTADPSASPAPGGGDPAPGTVADGPKDPTPVAAESGAAAASSFSTELSAEHTL